MVFNDDYNVNQAVLNYQGLVIASKAEAQDMDNYEEEEEEDDLMDVDGDKEKKKSKKNSHIHYKAFNEHKQVNDWHFELKDGESSECLAIGSGWVAALTDCGYIRIFSNDGI